jgi:hypothetical protein
MPATGLPVLRARNLFRRAAAFDIYELIDENCAELSGFAALKRNGRHRLAPLGRAFPGAGGR